MTVPTWDEYYLALTLPVASRVRCVRRRVGAVLVDSHNAIVSTGYNGPASGMPHCDEGACPRGLLGTAQPLSDYDTIGSPGFCIAIHAEANAVTHARYREEGMTIYISDPPCWGCRKLCYAAGVRRMVWPDGELVDNQIVTV